MYILFWVLVFNDGVTSGTREFASMKSCEKVKQNLISTRAYQSNELSHIECYRR